MTSRKAWCPGLKEDAYQAALDRAWDRLAGMDLSRVAEDAGGRREGPGTVVVRTFGRDCVVDLASRSVRIGEKELSPLAGTMVLHYLANAGPVAPTGKWVSYRQLPGGEAFYGAFRQRVILEIGALFHQRPELLLSALRTVGARKLAFGEASVRIDVFPKLPVAVIVWKGDSEVRGTANVLFDETAPRFLPTEDLAAVGSYVLEQLVKARAAALRQVHDRNTV